MANPNVGFAKARAKVGYSDKHRAEMREAAQRRADASPAVAIMRKVQSGEMTVDQGVEAMNRIMNGDA